MAFHEKLFELRKKAGMTQADLAEKLNVSRQAISRWEQGLAMPEIDNLIAMSDLFDVSLDYLLKGGTKKKETEKMEEIPKQWRPLVITATAAFGLLALWLLLTLAERSVFALFLKPLILIGALYAGVILATKL